MTIVYITEATTKYPFTGNLTKAEWGKWHPNGDLMICANVQINPAEKFVVTNGKMGGDPLYGTHKHLKLTFSGEAKCSIPEGGSVTEMKGNVKHAYWGKGDK